tara:strand:+ start:17 stop:259 length:243 start_codon:yes stop_codon:yes gene_type:complete
MSDELTAPARFAVAVTPSDSTVLTPTRGLYVGSGGNVTVRMVGDQATVTYTAVQTGQLLPISVDQVHSTNTTASSITAVW